MKKKSMESVKKTLDFSEDYVWMSYRYCIGRHTIAAHYHATTIAQDVYGKISDERMQFNSEDICSCIYDNLHFKDFIDFGWYGNIPKDKFKPLDVVYRIFDKEGIYCEEKLFRQICERCENHAKNMNCEDMYSCPAYKLYLVAKKKRKVYYKQSDWQTPPTPRAEMI